MSEDVRKKVDANSAEFKEGVEAGLNSEEDTKNWRAGNELGHELKEEEGEKKAPVYENLFKKSSTSTPLFMRHSSGGRRGNAQDEKDEMEE